jgi:hypothetical protein
MPVLLVEDRVVGNEGEQLGVGLHQRMGPHQLLYTLLPLPPLAGLALPCLNRVLRSLSRPTRVTQRDGYVRTDLFRVFSGFIKVTSTSLGSVRVRSNLRLACTCLVEYIHASGERRGDGSKFRAVQCGTRADRSQRKSKRSRTPHSFLPTLCRPADAAPPLDLDGQRKRSCTSSPLSQNTTGGGVAV